MLEMLTVVKMLKMVEMVNMIIAIKRVDRDLDGRVIGSVSAAIIAIQNGANIVRVHDVLETKDALSILESVNEFRE
jgi:dihydropteroate synthase